MDARPAQLADVSLLAQWNRQLIRDEGHRNAMSLEELETRMRGWLEGSYEAHIFSVDARPFGYVLARDEHEHVYLRQFFVLPESRRRGWGRSAIDLMIENVWGDTRRLRLDVLVQNKGAIEFWRSLGFRDYCLTMERE